jgi:uncharacterized membrane protein YjfL (UPF0719 family)
MLENIGLILAYSGVGIGVLVIGFYVLDALTPGQLGALVAEGNVNAAVLATATLVSLGLVMWFAIFFTGAGWEHLDDAAVYGAVGVGAQAAGFVALDLVTPGRLAEVCMPGGAHGFRPATAVAAGVQAATALIVCASLT